ncbi:MAG: hypothetical protein A3J80_10890 [Desulfobacula sp. RIFOXYB2_FULL_45_6]|nr:MAG: hypothetical protein A3J80_10890 [Desulfobacula sp. RIFOXYB2_FULL_45_6]
MMARKFSPFITGILFLIFSILGCSGLQKEPMAKQYFDLSIQVPVASKDSLCKGETLIIKEFSINSAFDSHSFIYKVGENEYITDYYSEFISYPSKLITEKTSEALYGSTHFRPSLTNNKKDITYRLSGKIIRLSGDFSDKNNTRAAIELMLILEKKTGSGFTPVLIDTYMADEPVPDKEPSSLVSGWNLGLSKILVQFITEFQHLPAS